MSWLNSKYTKFKVDSAFKDIGIILQQNLDATEA
jgi:hypothetical protein